LFINGDVILNFAVLGLANVSLSYLGWFKYMFVPSLLLMVIVYFLFILLFGINNKPFEFLPRNQDGEIKTGNSSKLSLNEKKVIVTSSVLIVLWITESLHGFASAYAAGITVIVLFLLRVLTLRDIKVINLSLVLYMTAAFSIGKVFTINGIAGVINEYIFRILPDMQSIFYYFIMALIIMILHFILGSNLTTLSIAIPTLINLPNSDPVMMALLAFSVVNIQYFLPLHNVTILIGAGKGYYSQRETIKMGACMFFIVLLYVPFVLVQWWRIVL